MIQKFSAKSAFNLRSVVFSHGWSDLPPFQVIDTKGSIRVGLRQGGRNMGVTISPVTNGVQVEWKGRGALAKPLIRDLTRMLGLDRDLTPFYRHAKETDRGWIPKLRLGRLLRGQTLFEDLIKLILTTNCSWGLTRSMTEAMVRELGEKTADGASLFPEIEAVEDRNEKFYREKIRAGYRSPHLPKIARLILRGEIDLSSWEDPTRPVEDIRKEILSVPGAGPYVADNLLRLLGRTDYLGLDSWGRGKLKEIWGMKKIPSDRTIETRYRKHGTFKGLVLWCDLTRDWFVNGDFSTWVRIAHQDS